MPVECLSRLLTFQTMQSHTQLDWRSSPASPLHLLQAHAPAKHDKACKTLQFFSSTATVHKFFFMLFRLKGLHMVPCSFTSLEQRMMRGLTDRTLQELSEASRLRCLDLSGCKQLTEGAAWGSRQRLYICTARSAASAIPEPAENGSGMQPIWHLWICRSLSLLPRHDQILYELDYGHFETGEPR